MCLDTVGERLRYREVGEGGGGGGVKKYYKNGWVTNNGGFDRGLEF